MADWSAYNRAIPEIGPGFTLQDLSKAISQGAAADKARDQFMQEMALKRQDLEWRQPQQLEVGGNIAMPVLKSMAPELAEAQKQSLQQRLQYSPESFIVDSKGNVNRIAVGEKGLTFLEPVQKAPTEKMAAEQALKAAGAATSLGVKRGPQGQIEEVSEQEQSLSEQLLSKLIEEAKQKIGKEDLSGQQLQYLKDVSMARARDAIPKMRHAESFGWQYNPEKDKFIVPGNAFNQRLLETMGPKFQQDLGDIYRSGSTMAAPSARVIQQPQERRVPRGGAPQRMIENPKRKEINKQIADNNRQLSLPMISLSSSARAPILEDNKRLREELEQEPVMINPYAQQAPQKQAPSLAPKSTVNTGKKQYKGIEVMSKKDAANAIKNGIIQKVQNEQGQTRLYNPKTDKLIQIK